MANYLQELFVTCCGRSKPPPAQEACQWTCKQDRAQSSALETRATLTSISTSRVGRDDSPAEVIKHSITNLDEAAGQLSTSYAEQLKCAFCEQDASGFCVGCIAVRYCRDCYKPQHKRKSGLHMFCSYSNTIPAVLARFQAKQTIRSDAESV